ncbi:MAG: coproporphyrinogen dehydrogenase HemZ [Clostridia bacterium]|nr:coproporphyrinogen dehydrogenase HemZ [Clostridia bacterium]
MALIDDYLSTIQPELINTARLFGMEELPPDLGLEARERDGEYIITFAQGDTQTTGQAPIPLDEDPRLRELHQKRAARRLCKQTLYDFYRQRTGIHPPWGSLTGVRPTHLMLEALSQGLSEEKAVSRLMADFDVTREKAELLSQVARVQRGMPAPGDEWMDVYIGIPFCTTRCAYCSFSSGEIGNGKLVAPYMAALARELRAGQEILRESGRRLRAVYVGGGTPTALPEKEFEQLMAGMMEAFPGAMEYTVEAGRPDTITRAKLRAIREAGVGRISINPQTMNDQTLRVIGRAHTAQQVREAYALAREEKIRHINMDVIAGLPGEGILEFAHTMEEALRLRPESLTVHTLAIKRSSPFGERQTAVRLKQRSEEEAPSTQLPAAETAAEMVRLGRDTAGQLGLQPYYLYKQKYMAGNLENTGYALPGHECVYNVDIMEETSHILALGAGGISKRIYPEEGHIGRAPNVSNIENYLARVEEMIQRKRELFLT